MFASRLPSIFQKRPCWRAWIENFGCYELPIILVPLKRFRNQNLKSLRRWAISTSMCQKYSFSFIRWLFLYKFDHPTHGSFVTLSFSNKTGAAVESLAIVASVKVCAAYGIASFLHLYD